MPEGTAPVSEIRVEAFLREWSSRLDTTSPAIQEAVEIIAALRQERDDLKADRASWRRVAEGLQRNLTEAEQARDALVAALTTLEGEWREEARLARPLETATLTTEKRARIARWMHFKRCADALAALLAPRTTKDDQP